MQLRTVALTARRFEEVKNSPFGPPIRKWPGRIYRFDLGIFGAIIIWGFLGQNGTFQ